MYRLNPGGFLHIRHDESLLFNDCIYVAKLIAIHDGHEVHVECCTRQTIKPYGEAAHDRVRNSECVEQLRKVRGNGVNRVRALPQRDA